MKNHNWTVKIGYDSKPESEDEVIKCEKYFDAVDALLDEIGEEANHHGYKDDWCKEQLLTILSTGSVDLRTGKMIRICKAKEKKPQLSV